MATLLAKNAEVLVTMDGQRRELKDAGLYAEDGIIKQVGPTAELPSTADTVIDLTGQRVSATDRLYLAQVIPTLIVWGRRDPLIPVEHAAVAHRGIPHSRLEIFDDTGHFPQLEQPVRFARVLIDFIESTDPAAFEFSDQDLNMLRDRMLERGRRHRSSGGD